MIQLSILVPTVPSRLTTFYPRIITELLRQTENYPEVEIIGLFDNKKRTIGQKRQDMLNLARGKYLVFIDDDDRISEDYVKTIIEALNKYPETDCVVFDCICKVNGGYDKLCKYGVEFEYGDILGGTEWRGKPAHTMVYKSSIAKIHSYADMNYKEDVHWVVRACVDIKHQTRIDKVLYFYDAEYTTTSETAGLSDETINKNIKLKFKK
jgi:glycosyltransferase involved in cell wall biosynthesis